MLIGLGVASTSRTDKFWHTGSAKEYSSEEFDGWGVRSYAQVWRSYLQAVLNECYFWFRQCGDVIIYVIPHYLYSNIIVVLMWYSTGIWVIWFTTVLLHFDSVDFPSRKSGRFTVRFLQQDPCRNHSSKNVGTISSPQLPYCFLQPKMCICPLS